MKTIKNSGRYITSETLAKCFEKGRHLKVDKGRTGNGFTTAMMNARVPNKKINILIMLNRGAIEGKEREYRQKPKLNKPKIAFVYGGSRDSFETKADLYIVIIDTFIIQLHDILHSNYLINWILIDESHTLKTDSVFRKRLKGFDDKIKPFLIGNKIAVTSVTASPMLYTKSDIFIENENMPEITISVTPDRTRSVENAIEDLNSDESVLIATNSKSVIYKFRDANNTLVADFNIGNRLMQTLLPMMKVVHDTKSKIVIISKKAFEGIDIHGLDYNVYFFEDRGREFETFYAANLYQAISRIRDGSTWMEYSRRDFSGDAIDVDKLEDEVDKLIAKASLSVENKQGSKFKKYSNYLIFEYVDKELTIKKDVVAFELLREKIEYDKGFEAFLPFFTSRNVKIDFLNEEQLSFKRGNVVRDVKKQNLTSNYEYIRKTGIYNDENFRLPINSGGNTEKDLKTIEEYLLLKSFDWKKGDEENEDKSRPLRPQEKTLLELFSDPQEMHKLIKQVTTAYNKGKIKKYGYERSKEKRRIFKERAPEIIHKICMAFGNGKIKVPELIVGSRDYNLFTEISLSGINIIAKRFSIDVLEIDIKSAYPRIMYALNGLELPEDFYGKNKKNKIATHIGMNSFMFNNKLNTTEVQQRSDATKKLKKLGFDEIVVKDLIERFFISPFKGDLFNYIAFYEKQIIDKLIEELKHTSNDGVVRRHDSVLIFNNKEDVSDINDFTFKGIGGWFEIPLKHYVNRVMRRL